MGNNHLYKILFTQNSNNQKLKHENIDKKKLKNSEK